DGGSGSVRARCSFEPSWTEAGPACWRASRLAPVAAGICRPPGAPGGSIRGLVPRPGSPPGGESAAAPPLLVGLLEIVAPVDPPDRSLSTRLGCRFVRLTANVSIYAEAGGKYAGILKTVKNCLT